ncbi:MAG: hypothetical protein O0V67_01620 [Methanocorpusculum sp.]|nr:hypothetical protein [Methanocorpusculum sp.]
MTEYPYPRELCGVYYRVERDGKWQNICFSDMTPDEMDEHLSKMTYEHVRGLVEAEVTAARDTAAWLINEKGWAAPEWMDISWIDQPMPAFTDGNITRLREIAKLVSLLLHAIGDESGASCRGQEETE